MSRNNCAIGTGYTTASFKGVTFQCTESTAQGGRRGAEGEFPFGENTAYADLGRRIRVYSITAVFREDNHISDSQALFRACESPGPGILVHPTRGAFTAACRKVHLKDNSEEQGETLAELEFVEANLVGSGIFGSLFGIISTGLSATSRASFLRDYNPVSVAQPWRRDIINTAQVLVGAVASVVTQTTPIDAPASARRELLKMEDISQDDGLAAVGPVVDRALYAGFVAIADNITDPLTEFKAFKKLANAAAKTSTFPTGVARTSEEAVLIRHRTLAGVGMAQAAMARKYSTIDEALTAMDQVSAVLEDEAKSAYDSCDNPLFLELRKYITQFKSMMNDLAYRLPPIVAIDFMGGVYPLVAAYAIYGDAKRHRELELRNILDANGRFQPVIAAALPVSAVT
jgi:prophage DNA circulation protein